MLTPYSPPVVLAGCGPGALDSVTLAVLRAVEGAELVLAQPGISASLLKRAGGRVVVAPRLTLALMAPEQRVVRLCLGSEPPRREISLLRAARIPFEVLAGVAPLLTGPLLGQTILVTRAALEDEPLTATLTSLGAEVLCAPTIAFGPSPEPARVVESLRRLASGGFDDLVMTSPHAVKVLFEQLAAVGQDARALAGVRLSAIGPSTAKALADHGLNADLVPESYVAEALLKALTESAVAGRRFLLPRAAKARDVLPVGLTEAGAQVTVVALYETLKPAFPLELVERLPEIQVATVTSASTASHLASALLEVGWRAGLPVACIGPIAAEAARTAGLQVIAQAAEFTLAGLTQAICDWVSGHDG